MLLPAPNCNTSAVAWSWPEQRTGTATPSRRQPPAGSTSPAAADAGPPLPLPDGSGSSTAVKAPVPSRSCTSAVTSGRSMGALFHTAAAKRTLLRAAGAAAAAAAGARAGSKNPAQIGSTVSQPESAPATLYCAAPPACGCSSPAASPSASTDTAAVAMAQRCSPSRLLSCRAASSSDSSVWACSQGATACRQLRGTGWMREQRGGKREQHSEAVEAIVAASPSRASPAGCARAGGTRAAAAGWRPGAPPSAHAGRSLQAGGSGRSWWAAGAAGETLCGHAAAGGSTQPALGPAAPGATAATPAVAATGAHPPLPRAGAPQPPYPQPPEARAPAAASHAAAFCRSGGLQGATAAVMARIKMDPVLTAGKQWRCHPAAAAPAPAAGAPELCRDSCAVRSRSTVARLCCTLPSSACSRHQQQQQSATSGAGGRRKTCAAGGCSWRSIGPAAWKVQAGHVAHGGSATAAGHSTPPPSALQTDPHSGAWWRQPQLQRLTRECRPAQPPPPHCRLPLQLRRGRLPAAQPAPQTDPAPPACSTRQYHTGSSTGSGSRVIVTATGACRRAGTGRRPAHPARKRRRPAGVHARNEACHLAPLNGSLSCRQIEVTGLVLSLRQGGQGRAGQGCVRPARREACERWYSKHAAGLHAAVRQERSRHYAVPCRAGTLSAAMSVSLDSNSSAITVYCLQGASRTAAFDRMWRHLPAGCHGTLSHPPCCAHAQKQPAWHRAQQEATHLHSQAWWLASSPGGASNGTRLQNTKPGSSER